MKGTPLVALSLVSTFCLCVAARELPDPPPRPAEDRTVEKTATRLVPASFDEASCAGQESASQDEASQEKAVTAPVAVQVFQMDDVLQNHRESKRSYTRFFKVPSLNTGVYTLPKGGKDGQSPHNQDELYYVLAGKAKMDSAGKQVAVTKGSLLFIAAGVEHRFVDVEEDLELLVVFSSGPLQKKTPPKK